jgi:transposase
MEQRDQPVLAVVQDGWKVTEVGERLGVSRQSVYAWVARYEAGSPPCPTSIVHERSRFLLSRFQL